MTRAARYLAWLRAHAVAIYVGFAIATVAALVLIVVRLPLLADFANLLPPEAPAVRDLARIEARVTGQDSVLGLVVAPDPERRATATRELATRIAALDQSLVRRVDDEDDVTRAFFRAHRHLFVPLEDLRAAHDALATRIQRAKLEANPLFIDLDEVDQAESDAAKAKLDELRERRRTAEAALDKSGFVSSDETTQLLVIRTSFPKTDAGAARRLVGALEVARAEVLARHPGIEIGFAGGPVVTLAEHTALIRGIVTSSLVTAVLVTAVLLGFLRSVRLVGVVAGVLVIATVIAFGLAAITVGHLNAATAFLGAIIAGNGVNYGILLVARYRDERRTAEPEEAMARAIAETVVPTLIASLGAAIAYASLAVTSFQGFADFAWIGSLGMLVCWIASFALVPLLVLRFAPAIGSLRRSLLGELLARALAGRRPIVVLGISGLVVAGALVLAVRYIANDPFEYDLTKLRSAGDDAVRARSWMGRSDAAFGRGIAGQTFIAADRAEDVRPIVDAIGRLPRDTVGRVRSIYDAIPADQPAKLAVLADLRTLLDDDALEALTDEERSELLALRPPDDLVAITPATLPPRVVESLTEADGRIGLLVAIRPAAELDEWNGRDLLRFATAIRAVQLPDERVITTSGASVIFADILTAVRDDGPRVTLVAFAGLVVMILLVVGRDRRAVAVLVSLASGAIVLVGVCALLDLRINFLDFVALPITLGLGVDYAINMAHGDRDIGAVLRTSGAAVVVCSATTIIGYGSLLVSDNLAIRGFGLASLIGEIAALAAAIVMVPMIARRSK